MTSPSNYFHQSGHDSLADNEDIDPVIFTSDDEHERDQLNIQSNIYDAKQVGFPEGGEVDVHVGIYSKPDDRPAKKPKLTGGLVSYTIDEEDEDETHLGSDTSEDIDVENAGNFNKDEVVDDAADEMKDGIEGLHQEYGVSQPLVNVSQTDDSLEFSTIRPDDVMPNTIPAFHSPLKVECDQIKLQNQTEGNAPDEAVNAEFASSVQFAAGPSDSDVVDTAVQEDAPSTETLTERLIREVTLPPEPPGLCRMELQEKVDREVRRMRLDISYDPNRAIQDNKAFRNPSIYEKLISFLNVDEKGTNFSSTVYNPYRWSSQSYYDELAKVQNREIDRMTKLQKEIQQQKQKKAEPVAQTVTAVGAGNSVLTGYTEPKKRSKWDAAAVTVGTSEADGNVDANAVKQQSQQQDTTQGAAPPVGSLIRRR